MTGMVPNRNFGSPLSTCSPIGGVVTHKEDTATQGLETRYVYASRLGALVSFLIFALLMIVYGYLYNDTDDERGARDDADARLGLG
jgi:hypothetical protein